MLNRSALKNFDFTLFFAVLAIFVFGLFFLYSASFQKAEVLGKNFTLQQVIWMGLGVAVLVLVLNIGYSRLIDMAYFLYGANILLLVLVLFLGRARLGAQRWLDLGIFTFQPSELAKVTYVLAVAHYLGHKKLHTYRFKDLLIPFMLTLVPILLILRQPDLGTSLVFLPILLVMLYAWGLRPKHLFGAVGVGAAVSPLFWFLLKEYQRKRLLVFVDPNLDPLGAGYTVIQSKIAIGSGGLFGKGWLAGTQNQLNFLPERHTDFIFSVIGEEWGFIGGIILIALYFLVIYKGFSIAGKTTNLVGRLLAAGISTILLVQVIVNVGMTMGFMPVVGLPLPLISYGGSSLLTTMLAIGILLDVGMRKPVF